MPDATMPINRDDYAAAVRWKKGINEIVFAVNTQGGRAWGVACRGMMR